MAPEDMEKTTFITEWGTYCYRVMPFGLKNAGATYQRAATTLFHDMMHKDVEVYVDDMIVKSRGRTEKEIRSFLGRLQYINRFIARLTDICEPIFRLLRKNQPTVWNDDCQLAFEKIKEYLLSPPVLVPPTPDVPLLLYLSISDMTLGSPLLSTSLGYQEIEALHDKSIKGSIVADHLASLPTSKDRPVDDDFPDEEFVAMTSLSGWCMYFDGAANQSGDALELGIRQMEVFGDSNWYSQSGDWKTRDVKLRPYHAYLELLVARFDDLRYVHLPRAQNRFADALATLASSVDIPIDVDDLPWYHDIYQFLRSGTYPEVAAAKDRRALRNLATRFVICGDTLYRRSADGMFLLCLDRASADRVSPKSSNGHEFILVAIDYFTKWVEAASYARLTSARSPFHRITHHLPLWNERRLRAADHVQAYQRKMARAFKKRVKPRPLQKWDLVLRILRGLIGDPRGKFRPSWSGPYVIRELTLEGAAWLMT
ncbi:hypothetical protein AAG906_022604 [Vitis piasezkii]